MGKFSLCPFQIFRHSDVEEESVHLKCDWSQAGYFRSEEIGLEGESVSEVWGPGHIAAENVGSCIDPAGAGAAFFLEAGDTAVLNDNSAVATDVCLVRDGHGQRSCGLGVEAQHGGVIGVQVGVAVQNEHVICCCVLECCANGASRAQRSAFDGVMENDAAPHWAEVTLNNSVQMAHGEDGAGASCVAKLIKQDFEEWAAGYRSHGLRNALELSSEARAKAACENDGFHDGRRLARLHCCDRGEELGSEVAALDEHAEDVFEGEVGLLDVHGYVRGHTDEVIAEWSHLAALSS